MEKYNIELTVNACNECPFLNCSDTGDDCNILRQGIHESIYSNIDFKFDKGWRYRKCPLNHPKGYLTRGFNIKINENEDEERIKNVLQKYFNMYTQMALDLRHDKYGNAMCHDVTEVLCEIADELDVKLVDGWIKK